MDNYFSKYKKYKDKYLKLKNIIGGTPIASIKKEIKMPSRPQSKLFNEKPSWIELWSVGEQVLWNNLHYQIIQINDEFFKQEITLRKTGNVVSPDIIVKSIDNKINLLKAFPPRKIILFGGSLCPPHKGHFDIIANQVKMLGDNSFLFIGIDDNDSHFFSSDVAKEILEDFVNKIGFKNKVKIFKISTSNSFPQIDVIAEADLFFKNSGQQLLSYRDIIKLIVGSDYQGKRIELLEQSINNFEEEFSISIDLEQLVDRDENLSSTKLSNLAFQFVTDEINKENFEQRFIQYMPQEFLTDQIILNKYYMELVKAASKKKNSSFLKL